MVIATTLVAVIPIGASLALRTSGVISSAIASMGIAMLLSLAASSAGNAYWRKHGRGADVVFGELLLWGWLRRWHQERQLANAVRLLADVDTSHITAKARIERRQLLLNQLAGALEGPDAYLNGHSRRVARHAAAIARELGLPSEQVARIRAAAAIHDVGKLRTPKEILNKPGRLTDDEFAVIKQHPVTGAKLVAGLADPELAAIVKHHHERMDGTGYPDGLIGEAIPLGARIIAVADTFDALTSARSYRGAAGHERALEIIRNGAGSQLDPDAVRAFLGHYSGKRPALLWATASTAPATVQRVMDLLPLPSSSAMPALASVKLVGAATAFTTAAAIGAAAAVAPVVVHRAQPVQAIAAAPAHDARSAHGSQSKAAASQTASASAATLLAQVSSGSSAARAGASAAGTGGRARRIGSIGAVAGMLTSATASAAQQLSRVLELDCDSTLDARGHERPDSRPDHDGECRLRPELRDDRRSTNGGSTGVSAAATTSTAQSTATSATSTTTTTTDTTQDTSTGASTQGNRGSGLAPGGAGNRGHTGATSTTTSTSTSTSTQSPTSTRSTVTTRTQSTGTTQSTSTPQSGRATGGSPAEATAAAAALGPAPPPRGRARARARARTRRRRRARARARARRRRAARARRHPQAPARRRRAAQPATVRAVLSTTAAARVAPAVGGSVAASTSGSPSGRRAHPSASPVMSSSLDRPRCYVASPLGFTEAGRHYYATVLIPTLATVVDPVDPWALTSAAEIEAARTSGSERELALRIGRRNVAAIRSSALLAAYLEGRNPIPAPPPRSASRPRCAFHASACAATSGSPVRPASASTSSWKRSSPTAAERSRPASKNFSARLRRR